jgi:hypothetical protein
MEDPEAYLRALPDRLAQAREEDPLPVVRFSLEAVANSFVVLGLLPAQRAEEILAERRPVLEAAGVRVGREIGELGVSPDTRGFEEARAVGSDSPRWIPLAAAAGPVRCRLRRHDLVITWATVRPDGILARYHGDVREMDRLEMRAVVGEVAEDITELLIIDGSGAMYLVSADNVQGVISGRPGASGETLWVAEGDFLAVPAVGAAGSGGGRPAGRWLEISTGSGQPVRIEISPPGPVSMGTTETPWPTPAECYLAELAPPAPDWSIASAETGTVGLDTAGIVAAVAEALLAVGALPPDSPLLTSIRGSVHSDWHMALWGRLTTLVDTRAGPVGASVACPAVRLPFEQATAVIEAVTAREDLVSVYLYGYPWASGVFWPMITPCFRVTAVDDTGVEHEGQPGSGSESPTHEGIGAFYFWPPVAPEARQLRVTVSTLWEAAWALIDIPGR